MSQTGDIIFTSRAYCKMLLHCAKYPHCAVNGVLLAQASKNPKTSSIVFVDSVPLFHICLNVSPMYEIAMSQIDRMGSMQGLVIAGYYCAEDNNNDLGNESSVRIVNKIGEYYPTACLVTINSKNFPSVFDGHRGGGKELPFTLSQCIDGKWFKRKDQTGIIVSDEVIKKADNLIGQRRNDLIDFDNHLDNLKMDWRNPKLNEIID